MAKTTDKGMGQAENKEIRSNEAMELLDETELDSVAGGTGSDEEFNSGNSNMTVKVMFRYLCRNIHCRYEEIGTWDTSICPNCGSPTWYPKG